MRTLAIVTLLLLATLAWATKPATLGAMVFYILPANISTGGAGQDRPAIVTAVSGVTCNLVVLMDVIDHNAAAAVSVANVPYGTSQGQWHW